MNLLLQQQVLQLQQQGLYRQRLPIHSDRRLLNFSSNDYLCLADDEGIARAFQKGFGSYPAGSGASMAVCGYHALHKELEQAFCQLLQVDDALLFSSGYAANLSIVMMLANLGITLLIDKAMHASFYDGIKLSQVTYARYRHNNTEQLAEKLSQQSGKRLVAVEGIFSMSGQKAWLKRINELCLSHEALCLVDEAHSFGIIGPHGLGAVAAEGLSQQRVPLRMIAFGKAMGAQGAIVAGCAEWIDALFQSSRSNIYSTAPSPAMAFGLLKSLETVYQADDRREQLVDVIDYFRMKIRSSFLKWRESETAIQQLQLACPHKALAYSKALQEQQILCLPMREPTVTRQDTGLRVVLNCRHEHADIDKLFDQLQRIHES